MIYTFVPMVILAIICLIVFFVTRTSQRRFYAPRTYLGSLPEQ
jgi:calcium permeable stress-gated cation channel